MVSGWEAAGYSDALRSFQRFLRSRMVKASPTYIHRVYDEVVIACCSKLSIEGLAMITAETGFPMAAPSNCS